MISKSLALAPNKIKDPYFKNVSLLLHGDGNNGGHNNTFLDSSSNNLTITRNGNVTQGTFSPFSAEPGKWSNYFDGSGDSAAVSSTAFTFGTGDFTIECWVNIEKVSTTTAIVSQRSNLQNELFFGLDTDNGCTLFMYDNGTGGFSRYAHSTQFTLNTWHHVVAMRRNNVAYIALDGLFMSGVSFTQNLTSSYCILGSDSVSGSGILQGYISNLRVIKGVAVYTGNFTPPSLAPLASSGSASAAAYPSTTNVNTTFASTSCSLLTCQDNRFKDNSPNNFTLTPYGDVKVTPTSPFAPSIAYTPSVHGGSGYFDGSGDYFSINNTSSFSFATGEFTIELYAYVTSTTPLNSSPYYAGIIEARSAPLLEPWCCGLRGNGGKYRLDFYSGIICTGNTNIALNQWVHLAIVKNNTTSTLKLYVNGIEDGSWSTSTWGSVNASTSSTVYIGTILDGRQCDFPGYISNLRILKGTALYTANFTPPTAPLTAITNTSLLCNFTNANIIDHSRKNDLETVGNAQVSTTTKKFGTGAMYFDGNGDCLYIPFNPNLNFGSSDFTVECWIYRNAIMDASYGDVIIYNFTTKPWSWGLCVNPDNKLGVVLSSTGTTWDIRLGSDPGYPHGSVNIALNTWYHITFVRKGSIFSTYVNGILDQQFSSSATISNSSTSTTIGRCHDGWTRYWNGYIDDLRITKGICRYDYPGTTLGVQTFTPPARSLPNQ